MCIVRLISNIIETNNVTHIKTCTQEKQETSFDVKDCEFRFEFWAWVLYTIDDKFHFLTQKDETLNTFLKDKLPEHNKTENLLHT